MHTINMQPQYNTYTRMLTYLQTHDLKRIFQFRYVLDYQQTYGSYIPIYISAITQCNDKIDNLSNLVPLNGDPP